MLIAIQDVPEYKNLTLAQKALIKVENIILEPNDDTGQLKIMIESPKYRKQINLLGFHNIADREAVSAFISSLNPSKLNNSLLDIDDWWLYPDEVLEVIKKLKSYRALSPTQKALIKVNDVSLTRDEKGKLTIKIANFCKNKVIKLSGFRIPKYAAVDMVIDAARLYSLVNEQKLASEITSYDVLIAIQALPYYKNLTLAQKALIRVENIFLEPNDYNGHLKIKVMEGIEYRKQINLWGFQNIAGRKAISTFISKLNASKITSIVSDKMLPSKITSQMVLVAMQSTSKYKNLLPKWKNLIKSSDINLKHNDSDGSLVITIANHGENKVINLNGFRNQKQANDEIVVKAMVQGLREIDLLALVDETILPDEIVPISVFEEIKKLPAFTSLTNDQKSLFKASDISLTNDNAKGKLIITIANHSENKVINLEGFQTTSQVDKKALLDAILFLDATSLNHLANKNVLPSSLSLKNVLDAIKNLDSIKKLTNNQKELLVPNDINLVLNDNKGTLEVIVKKYGLDKHFKISDFLSSRKKSLKNNKDDYPIAQTIGIAVGGVGAIGIFGYLIYHFAIKGKKSKKI